MILGVVGQPNESLRPWLKAALGADTALEHATADESGRWMPHPDVFVVCDLALLEGIAPIVFAESPVVVVVNHDSDLNHPLVGAPHTVTVSREVLATFTATDVEFSRNGMQFAISALGHSHTVHLPTPGEECVSDALIAVAVAHSLGLKIEDAIASLATFTGSESERWRNELRHRADGVTIVNDASEARPDSMGSALKTLTLMTYGTTRAVAVLGEMTVDDAESREEHDRIGRLVVRLNVGKLIVVGHGARHIHNAAGLEGSWDGESVLVDSAEEAYDLLDNELRDGDVVLVKSSKAAGLGFLGDRLGGKTA